MEQLCKIRAASVEDVQELLDIYRYYVENTSLTFEYKVPTLDDFRKRIADTLKIYPYLVAEIDDKIVGYAYAGRFHARAAYAWDAEMSIYLQKNIHRQGVGSRVYNLLEEILKFQGVTKLIALITFPQDEYSNFHSMQFHQKMGYHLIGKIENCGYKFCCWYSTLYMDKNIGNFTNNMKPIKSFDEVRSHFGL